MTHEKTERRWALHLGLGALFILCAACGDSGTETGATSGSGGSGASGGMGAAGGSGGMGGTGPEPVCEPSETRACYEGAAGTEDVGLCIGGTETCLSDGSGWGPCEDQVLPADSDDCDAVGDEDCDGIACSETVWATAIGGSGYFWPKGLEVDPMGNTIVAGKVTGTVTVANQTHEATVADILVMKFDTNGDLLWITAGVGTDSLDSQGLAVDETGAVYVAGSFRGTVNFGPSPATELVGFANKDDIFVVKVDANGQHVWSRYLSGRVGTLTYDPVGMKRVGGLAVDSSSVYVGGTYDGHFGGGCPVGCPTSANDDVWIRKIARDDGANVWVKAGSSPGDDRLTALALHPSGGIVAGGDMQGNFTLDTVTMTLAGNADPWIAGLGSDGSALWGQSLGATACEGYVYSIDGGPAGILVSGEFTGAMTLGSELTAVGNHENAYVGHLDGSGSIQAGWAFEPTTTNAAFFETSVAYDEEGDILVSGGFVEGVKIGDADFFAPAGGTGAHLTKLDPTGQPRWTRAYLPDNAVDDVWIVDMANGPQNHAHVLALTNGPVDFGGVMVPHDGDWDGIVARIQP